MNANKGFSLIETAIALVVLGLLLGGLMTPIATKIDRQNEKYTDQQLEIIREALLGYAVINQRLPCPAVDANGVALTPGDPDCIKEGFLPWADLGVGKQDAWDRPFRYRAEDEYVDTMTQFDYVSGLAINAKFKIDHNLTVTTGGDSKVIAVIFSYGKDGNGELENSNGTKTFTYDSIDSSVNFDDRLIWISKHTLSQRLVTANIWF